MFKISNSRVFQSLALAAVLSASVASMSPAVANGPAGWQVNAAASSLHFNTTKSGAAGVGGITETMRFKNYSGGMDEQGRIQLTIELSSIDSGVDIRNERMQTLLWNVAANPTVGFSAQVKPDELQKINAGKEAVVVNVEGQLSMAGQTKPVKAQLQVTPAQGKLLVSTRAPIIINLNDFGLNAGVEALRAIMGLNYLSTSAPVTFQLELSKGAARMVSKNETSSKMPPSAW